MKVWMLFAALGSAIGAAVTCWVARPGGRPTVVRMTRWIRLGLRHFQSTKALFKRWGPGLILFGRVVPGARTRITIPVGLARPPYHQFLALTFVGAYIGYAAIIGLGFVIDNEWQVPSRVMKEYTSLALAVLVLSIGLVWIGHKFIQQWLPFQSVPVESEMEKELEDQRYETR